MSQPSAKEATQAKDIAEKIIEKNNCAETSMRSYEFYCAHNGPTLARAFLEQSESLAETQSKLLELENYHSTSGPALAFLSKIQPYIDEITKLKEENEKLKSGAKRFADYVIKNSREDAYNHIEAKKFNEELERLRK